jgi:hypothetical protein
MKNSVDVSRPRHTEMHYVIQRSHRMQKHKFGVMCPGTVFVETAPVPPKHEKYYVDISHRGRTGLHYVTRRSNWIQKLMFGVTCPPVVFMKIAPGPPVHEK